MATSLERSEKEGQIGNIRSNTYHMVKIWRGYWEGRWPATTSRTFDIRMRSDAMINLMTSTPYFSVLRRERVSLQRTHCRLI